MARDRRFLPSGAVFAKCPRSIRHWAARENRLRAQDLRHERRTQRGDITEEMATAASIRCFDRASIFTPDARAGNSLCPVGTPRSVVPEGEVAVEDVT